MCNKCMLYLLQKKHHLFNIKSPVFIKIFDIEIQRPSSHPEKTFIKSFNSIKNQVVRYFHLYV